MGVESRLEAGHQSIVITLRQGVILVVVTASALHRQPKDCRREHVERLVDHFVPFFDAVLRKIGVVVDIPQKPRGDEKRLRPRVKRIGFAPVDEFIAGDLLDKELVERQIVIERIDDVIPVLPDPVVGIHRSEVVVELAVDISGGIQPVPSPSFAVVRRFQQFVDQQLVGVRTGIFQKRLQGRWFRGKPDQIKIGPTNEYALFRVGGEVQPFLLQPRQQKPVDRSPHASRVPDRWSSRFARRSKCPVAAVGLRHLGMRWQCHDFLISRCPRPDPAAQNGDFRGIEFFALARRHLTLVDQVDQQAAIRFATNDRRAVLTPTQDLGKGPQIEPGFLRVLTVTVMTLRGEHRQNILFERRRRGHNGIVHGQCHVQTRCVAMMRCRGSVRERVDNEIDEVVRLDQLIANVEGSALGRRSEIGFARNQHRRVETGRLQRGGAPLDGPANLRVSAAARLSVLERTLNFQLAADRAPPSHNDGVVRPGRDQNVTLSEFQADVVFRRDFSDDGRERLPRTVGPSVQR